MSRNHCAPLRFTVIRYSIAPALLTALSVLAPVSSPAADRVAPGQITAQEIVQKNSAARGGTVAWHALHSFILAGTLYTGNSQADRLTFLLRVRRPETVRIEVRIREQEATQVFDGETARNIASFLQSYEGPSSGQQASIAPADALDLAGPLVGYSETGNEVELEGTEVVDGRDAYRLKLLMKDGGTRRVWVDARSFLEIKADSNPRVINGRLHAAVICYRDYRPTQGLMIPHVFETIIEGTSKTERALIEAVEVNPALDNDFLAPE